MSDIHKQGFLKEAYIVLNERYEFNEEIIYKCIERTENDFLDSDICDN